MTRILTLAAVLTVLGAPLAADPVLGTYKTQPGDEGNFAHVQIYQCETNICGVIRKAFDASGAEIDSDTVGKRMIWGMQAQGDGTYAKGKIWAPDRDRTYNSKMELAGSRLEVSGCVLGICRGQTWQRVN
ncbi:MAG: DUF2147 domain-containing protein [Pseudomonadota bacterium]